MITISDEPFDPADALRAFTAHSHGAGGIVSFSGFVRPDSNGAPVSGLFLQAHPTLTEAGITSALEVAATRWSLIASRIIHRTGDIAPGEAIVFVATAAAHRRAAFEAADFLMDYLKTDAVFWKKESAPDGTRWIEPRDEDYADRARWQTEG